MASIIRQARPGDEKRVAEYAIKLFEQHVGYDPERFSMFADIDGAEKYYRGRFDTPESAVLVAEIDGEVVGYAYIEKDEMNYAELLTNGAWMHDIFIDESVRTEGIGKKLIDAAAEAAKELGAEKLLLSVAARKRPLGKFSRKRVSGPRCRK